MKLKGNLDSSISHLQSTLSYLEDVKKLANAPSKSVEERIIKIYATTGNMSTTLTQINKEGYTLHSKVKGSRKYKQEDIREIIKTNHDKVDNRLCAYVQNLLSNNRKKNPFL